MNELERAKSEAREWFERLSTETPSDGTEAAFRLWLRASAENAAAFRTLAAAWDDLALLELEKELAAPAPAEPPRAASVFAFRGVFAGLAVIAAAIVAFFVATAPAGPIEFTTGVGEIRAVTLADGSTATLDARSRIVVSFSRSERAVELAQGRAYFDVASDPERPFVVDAGAARASAVGTAFAVRRAGSVRVAVTEGVVDVAPRTGDVLRLVAGEAVATRSDGDLGDVAAFDAGRLLDWRNGRLAFDDVSLAEIVADMNRHRRTPVVIADAELAALRFTTAFRTDETDVFLNALPNLEAVRIVETDSAVLIRTRRDR